MCERVRERERKVFNNNIECVLNSEKKDISVPDEHGYIFFSSIEMFG